MTLRKFEKSVVLENIVYRVDLRCFVDAGVKVTILTFMPPHIG